MDSWSNIFWSAILVFLTVFVFDIVGHYAFGTDGTKGIVIMLLFANIARSLR